jgi:RNA polymerase sigma-70 factor, ECF subfamily
MDDLTILQRIKSGDRDAYALLVQKHHRNLLGFIFRIVKDAALAEDIGQEVFFTVYKELSSFDPGRGTPFAAWLYIVARNRCISELRKLRRREALAEDRLDSLPAGGGTAEDALIRGEELEALTAAVQHLPEPFRSTMVMSLKGATLEEISTKSGVPQATVKTRLFRAKEKIVLQLREYLGGVGHERRV